MLASKIPDYDAVFYRDIFCVIKSHVFIVFFTTY